MSPSAKGMLIVTGGVLIALLLIAAIESIAKIRDDRAIVKRRLERSPFHPKGRPEDNAG